MGMLCPFFVFMGDSIDERVQEIIETKKELGDYLVDGGRLNGNNPRLDDELRAMLRDL